VRVMRLSPEGLGLPPPCQDDIRYSSRYHGPCAICGLPIIGQELLRDERAPVHKGCEKRGHVRTEVGGA
jgi:hypothetical protein